MRAVKDALFELEQHRFPSELVINAECGRCDLSSSAEQKCWIRADEKMVGVVVVHFAQDLGGEHWQFSPVDQMVVAAVHFVSRWHRVRQYQLPVEQVLAAVVAHYESGWSSYRRPSMDEATDFVFAEGTDEATVGVGTIK